MDKGVERIMTTKRLYSMIVMLIALSFAVTAVLLIFMPEQVPMHYNAVGVMDRMGSKYENLILPVCAAVIGILFAVIGKSRKHIAEEKILLITGVFLLLFFNVLSIYFMYQAIVYSPGAALDIDRDVARLTFIALGILLIVIGNLMPKFRKNYLFGLRTKWTLASDYVWQKSNRFCGMTAVLCGFAMMLCSAVLSGAANVIVNTALLVAWILASVIASYRYYRAERQ